MENRVSFNISKIVESEKYFQSSEDKNQEKVFVKIL